MSFVFGLDIDFCLDVLPTYEGRPNRYSSLNFLLYFKLHILRAFVDLTEVRSAIDRYFLTRSLEIT